MFTPDEHDAFRCLPRNTTRLFRCLPMNTSIPLASNEQDAIVAVCCLFMYTSPGHTYAQVRGHIFCHPVVRTCTQLTGLPKLLPPLLGHGSLWQTERSTGMYTDNATYASTGWVPAVRENKDALPYMRRYSWWVPSIRGSFFPVIWTHFLACQDVAGGSQLLGGNIFFTKYGGPFSGSPLSGG